MQVYQIGDAPLLPRSTSYRNPTFDRVQNTYNTILPYLQPIRSLYHFAYSAKKIISSATSKPQKAFDQVLYPKEETQPLDLVEGCLYLGAATSELLIPLHHFGYCTIEPAIPFLQGIGLSCFFFTQLISLFRDIAAYTRASHLLKGASKDMRAYLEKQRNLAIMGIISTLGYLAAALMMLLTSTIVVALLLSFIAAFTNVLEFIYDHFFNS